MDKLEQERNPVKTVRGEAVKPSRPLKNTRTSFLMLEFGKVAWQNA